MLHDYGLTVYDQVETMLTEPAFEPPKVTNHTELHYFLKQMIGTLRILNQPYEPNSDNPRSTVANYAMRNNLHLGDYSVVGLTTINPLAVIDEGLTSGVVAPVNFALHLQNLETIPRMLDADQYANHTFLLSEVVQIDAKDMADRIDSPGFRKMLHQLAHAPNGFLGRMSADTDRPDSGYSNPRFSCFSTFLYLNGQGLSPFVLDETRRVTGFSDAFLAFKNDSLHEYNKKNVASSGGCPVRHAEYKVIGEAATEYFKQLGREDGHLVEAGESLIDRGARLASTALRLAAS